MPRAKRKTIISSRGRTLGKALQKARQSADLEQIEAADTLGVGRNTISNYERDIYQPPPTSFLKLCQLYKTSPEDLGFAIVSGMIIPVTGAAVVDSPSPDGPMLSLVEGGAFTSVPVWRSTAPGEWLFGEEGPEPVKVPAAALPIGNFVALHVGAGDSTNRPLAQQGQWLLVRLEDVPQPGFIVIARSENTVIVRRFRTATGNLHPIGDGGGELDPGTWEPIGTVLGVIRESNGKDLDITLRASGLRTE